MMNRFFKCVLLAVVISASAFSGTLAQAQDPTLREVADRKGVAIGAAISSWTFDADSKLRDLLAREFNTLTLENDAKWCNIHPTADTYNYAGTDRLVDFAIASRMQIHAHTLLWHECFPDYLKGQTLSRDEAIRVMREHIATVVGRYKGKIAVWDVVNEAFNEDGTYRETPWYKWIGEDYIPLAFEAAHEADPDALLFYNDYGIEAVNAKSDAVFEMVKRLLTAKTPIRGVGLQMHVKLGSVGAGRQLDPASLRENIQRFGLVGLQVQITEMDVAHTGEPTEAIFDYQAGHYLQIADACFESRYCTGLITWGVVDKNSWLRLPEFSNNPQVSPLLFDDQYQPKKARDAVLDSLLRSMDETPVLSDSERAAIVAEPIVERADLPEPVKTDANQLAPDSVPGTAYYAAFPVTITLDGDASDWANIPRGSVDNVLLAPPSAATTMRFAAAADDQYLYIMADVTKAGLVYGKHPIATEWYEEDSVEFYVNATGNLSLLAYEPGVAQIGIAAANIDNKGDKPLIGGGRSDDVEVKVVAVRTSEGYLVEAAIPLKSDVWTITPKAGGIIGFQVHLNGASTVDRDTKLIWSIYDTADNSWQDPSVFGQLIFWDKAR